MMYTFNIRNMHEFLLLKYSKVQNTIGLSNQVANIGIIKLELKVIKLINKFILNFRWNWSVELYRVTFKV